MDVVSERHAAQSKQKQRRQYLLELKTLFAGGTEYLNDTRAREDQSGAVAARAGVQPRVADVRPHGVADAQANAAVARDDFARHVGAERARRDV